MPAPRTVAQDTIPGSGVLALRCDVWPANRCVLAGSGSDGAVAPLIVWIFEETVGAESVRPSKDRWSAGQAEQAQGQELCIAVICRVYQECTPMDYRHGSELVEVRNGLLSGWPARWLPRARTELTGRTTLGLPAAAARGKACTPRVQNETQPFEGFKRGSL